MELRVWAFGEPIDVCCDFDLDSPHVCTLSPHQSGHVRHGREDGGDDVDGRDLDE